MPVKNIVDCGTISLDGDNYRLARSDQYKQEWLEEGIDEPPWHEGLPPLIGIEDETWHLGGFKSREGIAGTTEYGNTDNRWPFMMLPPPHVTEITLTGANNQIWTTSAFSIFEALDYIFIVLHNQVFRINKSTFEVTLSKYSATAVFHQGLRWEDTFGMVTAKDHTWKVTAIGTPDTWAEFTADSWIMAPGIDRLFNLGAGGYLVKSNLLRNVSTGLDPAVEENYADSIQCGPAHAYSGGMVAYGNTVVVQTQAGLYGVSADEGIGVPLVKRWSWDDAICGGLTVVEPHLYVPHARGVYRVIPGVSVESIGLEREVLNQVSLARGRFQAFVVDGQWTYGFLDGSLAGEDSYITVSRDRRSGEPGLSPVIWDTFIDLGTLSTGNDEGGYGRVRGVHISHSTDPPTLWFGPLGENVAAGIKVGVVKLPRGGGSPLTGGCTFAASGVRYSPRYNFGDWNDKDFPKVQIACKNVDATHYWSLAYRIDDGSWVTDDIDSAAMDVKSEGVKTFFFAVAAVGKEIQYRYTYTGPAADTTPGSLVYFKRFARPQSKKVPVIKTILHLAAGIKHDMAEEGRDAVTQFNDLNALSEQAASAALIHGGDTTSVWVRHIQLLQTMQEGEAEPEFLVEAILQKREVA